MHSWHGIWIRWWPVRRGNNCFTVTTLCGRSCRRIYSNCIGITFIVQFGIEDSTSALTKFTRLTATKGIVVRWRLHWIASKVSSFVETLGSPVASNFCEVLFAIPASGTNFFFEVIIVLKVASSLLVSDCGCAVRISTFLLTCLLIMHFSSGEGIWSWIEMIIEHVKVWIPINVASGIFISDFIAALLHFLLESLLVGVPYLGINSTGGLKSIYGVVWIVKLVHDTVVHAHVSLFFLVQGISLLKVALLIKILSIGIFTVFIPGLYKRLCLLFFRLLLGWNSLLLLLISGLLLTFRGGWLCLFGDIL